MRPYDDGMQMSHIISRLLMVVPVCDTMINNGNGGGGGLNYNKCMLIILYYCEHRREAQCETIGHFLRQSNGLTNAISQ